MTRLCPFLILEIIWGEISESNLILKLLKHYFSGATTQGGKETHGERKKAFRAINSLKIAVCVCEEAEGEGGCVCVCMGVDFS